MTDFVIIETIRRSISINADTGTDARIARERGEGSITEEKTISSIVHPIGGIAVNDVTTNGAGTELKKVLAKFGFKPTPNCKCNQHISEMNQKGVEWCQQNIDTIVSWLHEEAERAKLPFTAIGAKIIVKRAIHNAKKKLTAAKTAA